jgi:hypothetical protein
LVAHLVRDEGVVGSNPIIPIGWGTKHSKAFRDSVSKLNPFSVVNKPTAVGR